MSRLRFLTALATTLLAACVTTPSDSAGCLNIAAQVSRLVATSASCTADAECVCYSQTVCGLYGDCGAAINAFGRLQLDELISEWHLDCPNAVTNCSRCSTRSMSARCSLNRCVCQ
jgi:hypothetical protein